MIRVMALFAIFFLVSCAAPVEPVVETARVVVNCDKREKVIAHLEKKYGEIPMARGPTNDGNLIEFTHSEKTRNWTIIRTYPNGYSCLVDAGYDWQIGTIKPPAGDGI